MSTVELRDSEIDVKDILMLDIFSDEHFNCRGFIPESDVVDLARDIKENGLQNPILVQPWNRNPPFKWRIVSGHRRHAAYMHNHAEFIPCIIKTGLDETQALILNLGENLNRKQLNIIQEARALQRLKDAGMSQTDVALRLKVTRPWVQVRFYVLDLPPDIQEVVADGWLNQAQIHQLNAMTTDEQYAAVRHIKDQKLRAGTKRMKVKVPKKAKPENLLTVEERDIDQINVMLDHMMENGEVGLHTRVLAWAAGNISTIDLLKDFQQYVKIELGKSYAIPIEGLPGL